ncbi:hypothetical protein L914_11959 [Phytophthora nicotianae]|uniref:DUF6570 domain-containing protein n=1 Tax=Phytophthora nicotianae TaxID=4792 RepID=W2N121_PHYNI|nr:hypothetical protein L914_11959 [Phytophthora nicotianae]
MEIWLPRPLSKSGVVLLRSKNIQGQTHVTVRPNFIRRALLWLIHHNPLYRDVHISKDNLAILEKFGEDIPRVELSEEDENQLHSIQQPTDARKYTSSSNKYWTGAAKPTTDDLSNCKTMNDIDSEITIEDSLEMQVSCSGAAVA